MVQWLPIVYAESTVLGEREANRVVENGGGLAAEASMYVHVAGKWRAFLTCWDTLGFRVYFRTPCGEFSGSRVGLEASFVGANYSSCVSTASTSQ